MKVNPAKAKIMSKDTENKGREFVLALLGEEHNYESIKANFVGMLTKETLKAAEAKVLEKRNQGTHGAVTKAAEMLGLTRNHFSNLLHAGE
jgi:DNA-binding NtrC family response regulator